MEEIKVNGFSFSMLNEYFSGLDRQGPGSEEETKRALSFIEGLGKASKIADLGSGTGTQTFVLADNTEAEIIALDLYEGSIEKVNEIAREKGIEKRVKGIVGSMDDLPFEKESLDVIWSEGAIANIGFENGLKHWKDFLKQDGYVAVTYESWFTDERPQEIEKWWTDAVPEIDTIGHNVSFMQRCGYLPVAAFILPESAWIENYFEPQKERQVTFLREHQGDEAAEEMISFIREEYELYKKYKQYYGYVFYIGKKL